MHGPKNNPQLTDCAANIVFARVLNRANFVHAVLTGLERTGLSA